MATNENIWAWSTTAADNATADSAVNWSEGQDPGTVNNSARGMMAAIAKMTDVQSGNVTVGGSADAITITTGQTISSGHQAIGFRLCFMAAGTNTGATTVAVDGLSAVAIKRPNGDALSAGDIVSGAFHDIAFDGTNYKLLAAAGAAGAYGVLAADNTWTGANVFNGFSNMVGGGQLGDTPADPVFIKGQGVHEFSATLLGGSSASAWRTNLGLGTAATQNTGTSGATVPLLDGTNSWSNAQTITDNDASTIVLNLTTTPSTSIPLRCTHSHAAPLPIYFAQFNTTGGEAGSIKGAGTATTGTTFNTTSDLRLKENIRPIDNSGTIIDALQPRYWEWRQGGQTDFGLVAQEVAAIPEIAHTIVRGDDGQLGGEGFRTWQIEKAALVPILLAEIKSLRARVAALEARDSP